MHEFWNKLTTQEMAALLFETDRGLETVKELLHETSAGDKYDKFMDEVGELLMFFFNRYKGAKNDD